MLLRFDLCSSSPSWCVLVVQPMSAVVWSNKPYLEGDVDFLFVVKNTEGKPTARNCFRELCCAPVSAIVAILV